MAVRIMAPLLCHDVASVHVLTGGGGAGERSDMTGGSEHFDVIIVGAGLSGIGMAHHLQRLAPSESYAILEARDAIGGTWDLFRYPGIRSDSDMHTLGYNFRPWTDPDAI